jgi:hypothetical protein
MHEVLNENPIYIPNLQLRQSILLPSISQTAHRAASVSYPVSLPVKQRLSLLQHLRIHLLLGQAIRKRRRVCMNLSRVFSILNSRTRSSTVRIPFFLLFVAVLPNLFATENSLRLGCAGGTQT